MNILLAIQACIGGRPLPITIPSNWGAVTSATPVNTATKTLTVPSGNPGNVRFNLTLFTGGTPRYVKNGGAAVGITDGDVVNFANGDTLLLRLAFGVSGDTATITATDVASGSVVGDAVLTVA